MPFLLRRGPAARHALAWRSSSRDVSTPSEPLLAKPIAAVRHIFRDHSSGAQNGVGHHHAGHSHHSHAFHQRRQYPHHRKAPEISSDWTSLYLGSKLAYWSGLCYFPYETLCRTLEEEGLQLIAYGRTSYTCWYVADGCVDFEALARRAFPKRPSQEAPADGGGSSGGGGSGGGGSHGSDADSSTHTHGPVAGSPPNGASHSAGQVQTSFSRSSGWHAQHRGGNSAVPLDTPHSGSRTPTNDGGGAAAAGAAASAAPSGSSSVTQPTPHAPQPAAGGHAAVPPARQGHAGAHGHVLRGGHIHLHHEPQPLHLRAPHQAQPGQNGANGGAGSSGHGSGAGVAAAGATAWNGTWAGSGVGTGSGGGAATPGTRCRFVFLRGVQWGAHDSNTLSLSASLASFWPTPLLPPDASAKPNDSSLRAGPGTATSGSGSGGDGAGGGLADGDLPSLGDLVAHSGVAALARELLPVLLPHIRGAADAGAEHVVFAGHSLGGSLAKLVWALAILHGHSSPAASSVHTFGSPPVLAHASGGGGGRVLRVLRAPPGAVVNWVLEHDPVPRAMLTADPYFAAARSALPGLSALLALRGALLGEGAALSSGRFLYETVGELLLLRWAARGGCEAVPVSEADAESLLRMALDEATRAPIRSLQYWLDHHHASYHHDLEAAALAVCRRQERGRQALQEAREAPGNASPPGHAKV